MDSKSPILPNHVPKQISQSQLFLELTAISGEYPAKNIHRIIPSPTYARRIIATLKSEKMLKVVSKNGLKGYRLGFMGKRKLMAENPARFSEFVNGITDMNRSREDLKRRLRLHSFAEVNTLMHGAGVRIFQDTKPKVYFPAASSQPNKKGSEKNTLPLITTPCFYTSREQKLKDDVPSDKIRAAKAAGTLLTPTHIYTIYNTGSVVSKWHGKTEGKHKGNIHNYFCQGTFPNRYEKSALSGIMVGNGFDSLEKYLEMILKKQEGYQFFDIFNPFYYITNDVYGEAQIRLLCDHHKMASFRATMFTNLSKRNPQMRMEHDALTEDGIPVFFCCLPNIHHLCKFKQGIELYSKGEEVIGRVIALDFQVDMLRRFFGDCVDFTVLDFEKFVNWLDGLDAQNKLNKQKEVPPCGQ